ncbi:MAG: 4-hydroxyphenylpyruvate dioxygenase [Bdellovibrionaceae bacterium]|nr:4-hydroxyphenylpyruvate dioxygenase [Pseudobdellovibrionaceae bacterium]
MESTTNPIGIDGVDFVEYSGPQASYFESLFTRMGFKMVSAHPTKQVKLFRQGDINFILNTEPGSFAADFAAAHGPCICAMAFRVKDAMKAFDLAVSRGARAYTGPESKKTVTPFPAVYGIGDSLIYFMDEKNISRLYGEILPVKPEDRAPIGVGMSVIDHFTNNVPRGEMNKWVDFYQRVFNFRETRYFHIKGQMTGLESKVMRSPCGKFSIPINEPTEAKSQIQEYLDEYKGSGVQHLALLTKDIIHTLETMKESKIEFLTPPPHTYYKLLRDRVPHVTEDIERLEKNAILVDGDEQGYLLQIFTKNVIGPIFYEIIQRKNHQGFGEGNFQALFDAIERDQKERGYL